MKLITSLLLLFLLSCNFPSKKDKRIPQTFRIPRISVIGTLVSDTFENHLCYMRARYGGIFSFSDSIVIQVTSRDKHRYDIDDIDNMIRYEEEPGTAHYGHVMDSIRRRWDSLATGGGLEVFIDRSQDIESEKPGIKYNPVFIVNESKETRIIKGKDGYLKCVLEALDTDQIWYPVSKWFAFECGNGDFAVDIQPDEFLVVLFPESSGEFNTKLRLKIPIGNQIYYTTPFKGSIKASQFLFAKNDYKLDGFFWEINGGLPKEMVTKPWLRR
jgi:hypothetical protein